MWALINLLKIEKDFLEFVALLYSSKDIWVYLVDITQFNLLVHKLIIRHYEWQKFLKEYKKILADFCNFLDFDFYININFWREFRKKRLKIKFKFFRDWRAKSIIA